VSEALSTAYLFLSTPNVCPQSRKLHARWYTSHALVLVGVSGGFCVESDHSCPQALPWNPAFSLTKDRARKLEIRVGFFVKILPEIFALQANLHALPFRRVSS
jgi:hypothetical protein